MATVTLGMAVVFAVIGGALVLFVTEPVPPDITAIGVLVALAVLEPWTGVDAATAIGGFASSATLTILAMYVLSEGVRRTGIVDRLGEWLAGVARGDEGRLLLSTAGTTGVSAGLVNNTPIVAVFIPMVTDLADRAGLSPSKLLLPLSYAAMLGGTLTLIGTSTNLLASDLSAELLGQRIGMFDLTPLGVVVLLVGLAYLLTVGRWLTPARVPPTSDFTTEFDLAGHLSKIRVREDSPLVGQSVTEMQATVDATEPAVDVLRIERGRETYLAAASDLVIEPDDDLVVRSTLQSLNRVASALGLQQRSREEVREADLVRDVGTLVEAVVLPDSGLVGQRVDRTNLTDVFHTTVLAIRRGGTTIRQDLGAVTLEAGDTLLVQTTDPAIDYLTEEGDLLVSERPTAPPEGRGSPGPADRRRSEPLADGGSTGRDDRPAWAVSEDDPDGGAGSIGGRGDRRGDGQDDSGASTPVAVGILLGVVALAATGAVPIVIAALGGVVAMVATGCLTAADAYDAVSWNVIFLLAGVLPLGVAMQGTGGDALVASLLVASGDVLPVVGVLAAFYLVTAIIASLITPVATVVLMIPIAVDVAARLGADGFAFLLAVTFACSGAFISPIGYQTNLMVYGPGGYRFGDYLRVGAPLQVLLTGVVTAGIVLIYGV